MTQGSNSYSSTSSWPIPSFTCSLNFANCRLRAGAIAKQLSGLRLFGESSASDEQTMSSPDSNSVDGSSGGYLSDRCSVTEDEDEMSTIRWPSCNGHRVCRINEIGSDCEEVVFEMSSPVSPVDTEVVVNPPVPLPPLMSNDEGLPLMKDHRNEYGSSGYRDSKSSFVASGDDTDVDSGRGSCTVSSEEVPDILAAVSNSLTVMIGRDVPIYLDLTDDDNDVHSVCLSELNILVDNRTEGSSEKSLDSDTGDDGNGDVSESTKNRAFECKREAENKIAVNELDRMIYRKRNVDETVPPRTSINGDRNHKQEEDYDDDEDDSSEHRDSDSVTGSDSDATIAVEVSNDDHEEIFVCDIDGEDDVKKDEVGGSEGSRITLQRSTSLKSGKTPPGTPHRKKIVRFADAMGLDLEAVKQITQEDLPKVPKSAYVDLQLPDSDDSPSESPVGSFANASPPTTRKMYVPFQPSKYLGFPVAGDGNKALYLMFDPPRNSPDFMERVKRCKLCLEDVTVSGLSIRCQVRVANVHFEKKVYARFTSNEWSSSDDMAANYVLGSNDSGTDQFSFTIYVPFMSVGQRLCFALKYAIPGQEFWDNNNGFNYCLRCDVDSTRVIQDDSNAMSKDENPLSHGNSISEEHLPTFRERHKFPGSTMKKHSSPSSLSSTTER